MEKITKEQVLEELSKVVANYGENYTYEYLQVEAHEGDYVKINTCMYTTTDNKPSCIVGQVLSRLTPEVLELIHKYEWEDELNPRSSTVDNMYAKGIELDQLYTDEAMLALTKAQREQDAGGTWGSAVEFARRD